MVVEMDQVSAAARTAADLGDRPLVVLSAGLIGEDGPDSAWYLAERHDLHRELAALSRHGVHRIVPSSNHLSLVMNEQHEQGGIALWTR